MLLRFSFITMQVINMFSREYMHRGTQSFTRTGSLPIIHTPLYKRANVFAYHCSKTECGCCKNVYCVTVCVYGYYQGLCPNFQCLHGSNSILIVM
jgi:hypothetical protein